MIVNFNETLGACLVIRKQKYVVLLRYVENIVYFRN